ncbi:serine hydrolase domain-containing protein [Actinomycetospora rhizophila]|uniref:Serine hydrolase domain-containing protein n=1 Tax=Actinomycetospora rhizophila TaxID=1416876 RepID=A0ABV9ZFK3_9PSEU
MSARRLAVATAALLTAGALTACGTVPAPPPAAPDYADDVAQRITATMSAYVVPGAVVRISSPTRGEWTGTFGTGTIGAAEPPTVDDHVRIGSITKTMTSTVILQLVGEGRLSLDDPIGKFRAGVPNGDRITIAQLSEMRSGLFSYTFDPAFNATLDADPGKAWTPDELLAIAFAHPVDAEPGTQFEYSNTNIVLLGLVIEQLTGAPVAQAFQERIFTPLGMSRTSLPARTDAAIPDPHPRGYSFGTNVSTIDGYALPVDQQAEALAGRLRPRDETDANPSWAWTAGGAISTVPDLVTWAQALVGGRLLDPGLQQVRMDSIRPADAAHPGTGGYGLGIARFGPIVGHDGQIPGFMTFTGQDPATGLTITIATNLATVPSGEGSAVALLKAILPVFYPGMAVPGSPAAAPSG